MYCNNCGKKNPEESKFCQHCGTKFVTVENDQDTQEAHVNSKPEIDADTPPYPYVVSITKLTILSIATFGTYQIYWFYKHFKSFKAERNWKITPWARALFSTLMSYSLFKQVSEAVHELDKRRGLEAGILAIAFFLLNALWKLPDPYWWISIFAFLPLIPVQKAINYYWQEKLGDKVVESHFGIGNIVWTIIGGIILLLAIIGTFSPADEFSLEQTEAPSQVSAELDSSLTSDPASSELETTYEENFMKSCAETEADETSCSCMLGYLQENYSLSERVEMGIEYAQTNEPPQAVYDAAYACVN